MIGGMKDQQVANIRLDDNQPLPGQYDIDIYVNKQWRGKYEIIVKDKPARNMFIKRSYQAVRH